MSYVDVGTGKEVAVINEALMKLFFKLLCLFLRGIVLVPVLKISFW